MQGEAGQSLGRVNPARACVQCCCGSGTLIFGFCPETGMTRLVRALESIELISTFVPPRRLRRSSSPRKRSQPAVNTFLVEMKRFAWPNHHAEASPLQSVLDSEEYQAQRSRRGTLHV